MKVTCIAAEFEGSYPKFLDLPKPGTPKALLQEVGLLGRSNVGKSTLLNLLTQKKKLARTGRTPGVTRAINVFNVELQSEKKSRLPFRLVDLPGFGFAKVSLKEQSTWVRELGDYVTIRDSLKIILLLVDSRRGIQEAEVEVLDSLDKQVWIVLTKIDQIPRAKRQGIVKEVSEAVGISEENIFTVSSLEPEGVWTLRSALYAELRRLMK